MGEKRMNVRQRQIAAVIAEGLNAISSTDRIASRLGYRPAREGRLSVSSSLHAMMRAGFVGRIPPQDRWDHVSWFLTKAGKAEVNSASPDPLTSSEQSK
jgi:hypothetical protein